MATGVESPTSRNARSGPSWITHCWQATRCERRTRQYYALASRAECCGTREVDVGGQCQDGRVASDSRMVALGFGMFARADRIFALERITGEERGDGRRTRVWIDGVADPLIASRTEMTILRDMDQESVIPGPQLDEALNLAARLVAAADEGRVDLSDLGRRARHLLASTTGSA
jgi:hypothetical protein